MSCCCCVGEGYRERAECAVSAHRGHTATAQIVHSGHAPFTVSLGDMGLAPRSYAELSTDFGCLFLLVEFYKLSGISTCYGRCTVEAEMIFFPSYLADFSFLSFSIVLVILCIQFLTNPRCGALRWS